MRLRRVQLSLLVASLLAAAVIVIGTSTTQAGSQTTTNACKSNATSTYSDLAWTLGGTATPNPATTGDTVTLSGASVQVNIPATLLIAGYNLGLLNVGANSIPTTVYVARSATNATPATQVDNFSITATTTITDPDGIPGTGDESATPLAVNQPLPDYTVTAGGGNIAFAQAAPGTLPSIPGAGPGGAAVVAAGSIFASAQVAGGLIKANFDCSPGNTIIDPPGGTSGTAFTPATAQPFETVTVNAPTTTTTQAPTTTTTQAPTTTTTQAPTTTTTQAPTTTTTTMTRPGPPKPPTLPAVVKEFVRELLYRIFCVKLNWC
jgi:hypothetical protein